MERRIATTLLLEIVQGSTLRIPNGNQQVMGNNPYVIPIYLHVYIYIDIYP